MSLIGIDVGSSAVKVAAYRPDGVLLAGAREPVIPQKPHPGYWEVEPEAVWEATLACLGRLAGAPLARDHPPEALAVSASGREGFPVAADGTVLGPCIMAADLRGEDIEVATASRMSVQEWVQACGHVPKRMDPTNRLLWWYRQRPEVMARARAFLGWHEFLTLRLAGLPVVDRSLAGKWLIYDLATGQWSPERIADLGLDPTVLPEVRPWGSVIGTVRASLARELGLPPGVPVAVGAFDASCAALGSGAARTGVVGLLCGSWEDLVAPTDTATLSLEMASRGFSLEPHPGSGGLALFSLSPNGTAVVDWARDLAGMPLEELEERLQRSGTSPSPLLAVPHLSGATVGWVDGRRLRGGLLGLTLATSPDDVVKALMESIAYDLALAAAHLRGAGIPMEVLRASGGGARSGWWMQLKADLCGVPVEVVDQPEPGTVGAALLAGLAVGNYGSLEEGAAVLTHPVHRYEPDDARRSCHAAALARYQEAMTGLLSADWAEEKGTACL